MSSMDKCHIATTLTTNNNECKMTKNESKEENWYKVDSNLNFLL